MDFVPPAIIEDFWISLPVLVGIGLCLNEFQTNAGCSSFLNCESAGTMIKHTAGAHVSIGFLAILWIWTWTFSEMASTTLPSESDMLRPQACVVCEHSLHSILAVNRNHTHLPVHVCTVPSQEVESYRSLSSKLTKKNKALHTAWPPKSCMSKLGQLHPVWRS